MPLVYSRIRSQHSRMWIRYRRESFAGIRSESYGFGEDAVADVRMNRAAFDYIDIGPQQIPDIAHETREVEDRAPCYHVHQEIHVAIRPVLLHSHRAENTDIATPVNACKAEDLAPLLVPQRVQRYHGFLPNCPSVAAFLPRS